VQNINFEGIHLISIKNLVDKVIEDPENHCGKNEIHHKVDAIDVPLENNFWAHFKWDFLHWGKMGTILNIKQVNFG